MLALEITFAALISEVVSRTADWFRFQNQHSGCCQKWWRQELDSEVGSWIDGKKTDIKVDGNNCAGRQTTAGLTSGLMARLDEKIGDGFCDSIGGKIATQFCHRELNWAGLVAILIPTTDESFVRRVATQIGHRELNWAGLVAGRHTKKSPRKRAGFRLRSYQKKPRSFDQGCLNYWRTTPAHQRSALTAIVLFNGWLILKFYADKITKQPANF